MLKEIRERLVRFFRSERPEGLEELETPQDEDARFALRFEDLLVGHLTLSEGLWTFTYSDEFKSQTRVPPMVDFPSTSRAYQSRELWPFFVSRIPSLSQPRVLEAVEEAERKGEDARSAVALLRRYGRNSISNPFTLEDDEAHATPA
jgi:HipA-like protein